MATAAAVVAAQWRELRTWLRRAGELRAGERMNVEDVGVFLLAHLDTKRCEGCVQTTVSSRRHAGWFSHMLGRRVLLCDTCAQRHTAAQRCPWCGEPFRVSDVYEYADRRCACTRCGCVTHG